MHLELERLEPRILLDVLIGNISQWWAYAGAPAFSVEVEDIYVDGPGTYRFEVSNEADVLWQVTGAAEIETDEGNTYGLSHNASNQWSTYLDSEQLGEHSITVRSFQPPSNPTVENIVFTLSDAIWPNCMTSKPAPLSRRSSGTLSDSRTTSCSA